MDMNCKMRQAVPFKVRVASGGRIVIPAEIRQELGVQEGEELLITRDELGFRITTYQEAIRRAQVLFAQIKSEGGSVADELLRERREEASLEGREFRDRSGAK